MQAAGQAAAAARTQAQAEQRARVTLNCAPAQPARRGAGLPCKCMHENMHGPRLSAQAAGGVAAAAGRGAAPEQRTCVTLGYPQRTQRGAKQACDASACMKIMHGPRLSAQAAGGVAAAAGRGAAPEQRTCVTLGYPQRTQRGAKQACDASACMKIMHGPRLSAQAAGGVAAAAGRGAAPEQRTCVTLGYPQRTQRGAEQACDASACMKIMHGPRLSAQAAGGVAAAAGRGPAPEQHARVFQGRHHRRQRRQRGGERAERERDGWRWHAPARQPQAQAAHRPPEADHHPGRPARPRQDLPVQQAHVLSQLVRSLRSPSRRLHAPHRLEQTLEQSCTVISARLSTACSCMCWPPAAHAHVRSATMAGLCVRMQSANAYACLSHHKPAASMSMAAQHGPSHAGWATRRGTSTWGSTGGSRRARQMCRMRRSLTTTTRHALTLCKAQLCSKASRNGQQRCHQYAKLDVTRKRSLTKVVRDMARHQKRCPRRLLLHHTEPSILSGRSVGLCHGV